MVQECIHAVSQHAYVTSAKHQTHIQQKTGSNLDQSMSILTAAFVVFLTAVGTFQENTTNRPHDHLYTHSSPLIIHYHPTIFQSHGSSVSIATCWTTGVRFLAGTGIFFLLHLVRTDVEVHSAFYSLGTRGSFP
jgi:hypothetical protein